MAGSVNRVILIGHLGKDPEVRTTANGKMVNLLVATSDSWIDRETKERQERTEWNRVTIFNDRIAGVAERYLKKGAHVYLEGALQTRKWVDKEGQERYATEIVIRQFDGQLTMLDGRPGNGNRGSVGGSAVPRAPSHPPAARPPAPSWSVPPADHDGMDDDLPY